MKPGPDRGFGVTEGQYEICAGCGLLFPKDLLVDGECRDCIDFDWRDYDDEWDDE